jgi:hypothetical protein
VAFLAENQSFPIADSIREAGERLALEHRAQAEQIQKLELEVTALRLQHERVEQEGIRQWKEIARSAELAVSAATDPQASPDKALENILGAVRNLMTCTLPEQVFEVVTEEAAQWGVRAAVFDVHGKAAWGAAANGFGPALSARVFRSVIVPLNQENPFRQVCETAGHVDANTETLKKNRNVMDKLKPPSHASVLLLPIRSGGTVSAIFYADSGVKGSLLPVNVLKILAEFAGAQIDRLIALSGGISFDSVNEKVEEAGAPEAPVEDAPLQAASEQSALVEIHAEEPVEKAAFAESGAEEAMAEAYAEGHEAPVSEPQPLPVGVAPEPVAPVVESAPAPPVEEVAVGVASPVSSVELALPVPVAASAPPSPSPEPPAPAGFDVSQLSEGEQKVHKDAKRFAKLLVSEIELYNKAKVADGRKNKDLYKRLKSDINRSRQTFEKRFGKGQSKQIDYIHDELIKTLAANDPAALGPEYPGPSA